MNQLANLWIFDKLDSTFATDSRLRAAEFLGLAKNMFLVKVNTLGANLESIKKMRKRGQIMQDC